MSTLNAHAHGTTPSYWAGCRCLLCSAANANRQRHQRALHAQGIRGLVDVAPTRNRLRQLMAAGWGRKALIASGIPAGTIRSILDPNRKYVTHATAELIANIRIIDRELGAQRRIQALRAIGIPVTVIAEHAGVPKMTIVRISNRRPDWISNRVHQAVLDVYEELWDRSDLADIRSVHHAARLGWVPPMVWDDADLDDPTATPHMGKTSKIRYLVEEAIWRIDLGESIATIATDLDVDEQNLRTMLRRSGRAA